MSKKSKELEKLFNDLLNSFIVGSGTGASTAKLEPIPIPTPTPTPTRQIKVKPVEKKIKTIRTITLPPPEYDTFEVQDMSKASEKEKKIFNERVLSEMEKLLHPPIISKKK